MTVANLGIAVTSNADKAAIDLDRLTGSATKAEVSSARLAERTRGSAAVMFAMHGTLTSIERDLTVLVNHQLQVARGFDGIGNSAGQAGRQIMAARQAMGGGAFATANLAQQAQDIVIAAQMGQSAVQVGLQQGMQAASVLQMLRASGQSTGSALLAAFGSLLSPVNLLTIGLVALGAAGIQSMLGVADASKDAEAELANHKKWLDEILTGYEEAQKAAERVATAAEKLPAGVVASDIRKSLKEQAAAANEFAESLRRVQNRASEIASMVQLGAGISRSVGQPDLGAESLIETMRTMQEFSVNTSMTSHEIGLLMTATRELFNTTENPAVKELASDFYDLAESVRQSKAETEAQEAALRRLQSIGNINIDLSIRSNVDAALEGIDAIKALAPDLRTAYEKVDDALAGTLLANSNLPLMLRQTLDSGARQAADAAKAALDQKAAQEEAARSAREGAQAAKQLSDAYQNVLRSAQERIAQAQIEVQALGMTEGAAARLRAQHELLTAAQNAGVIITADVRAALIGQANAAANAEERLRLMTKAHEDHQRMIQQTTDALAGAAVALFRPWKDLDDVVSNVMGSFASIGQTNLKSSLTNLLNGTGAFAANDNGGWSDAWSKVGAAVRDGAKEGTSGGLTDFLKNNASNIGAGLGGLGIGYQTQNPLMGALGGALAGASAGPIGAVIGGIAGLVGGLIGMSEELEKNRKLLAQNKQSISAFIGAGFGKEIDETTAAVLQYKAQAAEYIKLAEAAGDKALVRQLKEAAAAYRETLLAQKRIADAQKAVDDSRDTLREAYERESAALRDVIDRSKAFVESIRDFKKSLLLDGNLSPLSPQDRLIQAQMQFQSTSTAALNGDAGAQGRLQDAATSYLEQARDFYASSGAYASIFDQVQTVLDRAIAAGSSQVSDAERQLSVMTDQVSKLIDINTAVLSVADAITKLNADMATLQAAQIAASNKTTAAVDRLARETSQQGGKRAA